MRSLQQAVAAGQPLRHRAGHLDAELAEMAAALPLALAHSGALRCSILAASPAWEAAGLASGGLLVTLKLELEPGGRLPARCSLLLSLQSVHSQGVENGWALCGVPRLRGGQCTAKTVLVPGAGHGPLAVLRVWLLMVRRAVLIWPPDLQYKWLCITMVLIDVRAPQLPLCCKRFPPLFLSVRRGH